MYKFFVFITVLFVLSCKQKTTDSINSTAEIKDPHSLSNPSEAIVKHLDLDITVNFKSQQLTGKASWTIANLTKAKQIVFDTRDMQIQKVTSGKDERDAKFALGEAKDYLGQPLTVNIDAADSIVNI